jgi:hypothetical protein
MCSNNLNDGGAAHCVERISHVDLENCPLALAWVRRKDGLLRKGYLLAYGVALEAVLEGKHRSKKLPGWV